MFLISLVVDRSTGDLVYLIQDTPHPPRRPEAPLVSTSKQALGRRRAAAGTTPRGSHSPADTASGDAVCSPRGRTAPCGTSRRTCAGCRTRAATSGAAVAWRSAMPGAPDRAATIQPDGFSLPRAEREYEPDTVSPRERGHQEPPDLVRLERLDLVFFDARRLCELHQIAGDVLAEKGFAERSPCGAVHLVRRCCFEPGLEHLRVQLLEVLRLDLVDAVRAQIRNEVLVHLGAVRVPGLVADGRKRDVFEPVSQPIFDRPRATAFLTLPAPRCFSSVRTASMTSASVLRSTWRRSGLPSSRIPMVTRPCHFPSFPR